MRVASACVAASLLILPLGAAHATAVIAPVYGATVGDCTTNQNRTGDRWSITAGCDSYQNEFYERPTSQTYTEISPGRFGADEYHETLDIRQARVGADANYLYVGIEMVGLNHLTASSPVAEHLRHRYVFLMSNIADGAFGHMLEVDAPALANGGSEGSPNTVFSPLKTTGYKDTNGDVGGSGAANGLSITKSDNDAAALGNGFDLKIIGDGQLDIGAKPTVLYARVNPANPKEVEFALAFGALGYSQAQISAIIAGGGYMDFRTIKGGPADPQNFLWNDEYTLTQAGTPYAGQVDAATGLVVGPGLGNVYLADTLRYAAPIPEPATWAMMIVGFGLIGAAMRCRASKMVDRTSAA